MPKVECLLDFHLDSILILFLFFSLLFWKDLRNIFYIFVFFLINIYFIGVLLVVGGTLWNYKDGPIAIGNPIRLYIPKCCICWVCFVSTIDEY